MPLRALITIVCLGAIGAPNRAGEPKVFAPIDPETVAAYEKAGAECGGFDAPDGMIRFTPGTDAATTRLPGFRFRSLPTGGVHKLPPVRVPFGLDLQGTSAADADLEGLGRLTNLTALDLSGTSVTDAGLKALKGLTGLTTLGLCTTEITDAGVAELKDFKGLTAVGLFNSRATTEGIEKLCRALPNLEVDVNPKGRPINPEAFATDIKPGTPPPAPPILIEWTDGVVKIGPRSPAETNSPSSVPSTLRQPKPEPLFDDSRQISYLCGLALVALLGRFIGRVVAKWPRLRDRMTVGALLSGVTTAAIVVGFCFLILRLGLELEFPVSSKELLCYGLAVVFGAGSYLVYRFWS